MKREALRVGPIPISKANIDRKNLLIRDTVAMQIGEARGHGMWADAKTLSMMAELGNKQTQGIKGHMGHPGMSDNAFAREVMRAKNFRVVGDKLIHDTHFYSWAKKSPAFSEDPVNYIFDRAEENPESFGESVVVWTECFWVKADGSELNAGQNERPDDALYEFPSMRPKEFYYVDFVTDGALTPNGLFSTEAEADFWRGLFADTSSEYAEQAFALLYQFQMRFGLSDKDLALKVPELIGRYNYWKGFKVEPEEKTIPQDSTEPDAFADALADAKSVFAIPAEAAPAPDATPIVDTVPRSELDAVKAELAEVKKQAKLTDDLLSRTRQDMAQYIQNMNAALGFLQKQVAKLSAEPVETKSVPMSGNAMFATQAPVPSQMFSELVPSPKPFAERAQAALANGEPLDLKAIAAIEDPVEQEAAIKRFNESQNLNPFGYRR